MATAILGHRVLPQYVDVLRPGLGVDGGGAHRALAGTGWLSVPRSAETLRGVSNDFHLCHTYGTFYYQLKDGAPGRELDRVTPARARIDWVAPSRLDDNSTWVDTARRAAERINALAEISHTLASPPTAPARSAPDLATRSSCCTASRSIRC